MTLYTVLVCCTRYAYAYGATMRRHVMHTVNVNQRTNSQSGDATANPRWASRPQTDSAICPYPERRRLDPLGSASQSDAVRGCLGGGGCEPGAPDGIPIVTSEDRRRELFARIRPPARVCSLEASPWTSFGSISPVLSPLGRSAARRQHMAQRQRESTRVMTAAITLSGNGKAAMRADSNEKGPRSPAAAATRGAVTSSCIGESGEGGGCDGAASGG